MHFEVAGLELAWWIPPLVSCVIATIFTSGGVSGAFILLPFQVSVLGFSSPAVTPTNHLYNVVAIPGGVYRYIREGRMLWPLAAITIVGTLPGVVLGSWLRVAYLPDARTFKLFTGFVLLLIGGRMLWENILRPLCCRLGLHRDVCREAQPRITPVEVVRFDWRRLEFRFSDKVYGVSVPTLILLTTVVGMLGGAYGVGGGAIISPFLVTFLQLPVYTVAGASLLGTFLTSAFAVVLFTVLAPLLGSASLTVSPDWMLGGLFGLGGLLGTYLGASLQRYLPQQAIKIVLALGVTVVSTRYIVGYFL